MSAANFKFRSRSQKRLQTGRNNTGAAISGVRDARSFNEAVRTLVAINRRHAVEIEKERARNVRVTLAGEIVGEGEWQ